VAIVSLSVAVVSAPVARSAARGDRSRAPASAFGTPQHEPEAIAVAAGSARIRGPRKVHIGRRVTLVVSGFPPQSRIRVQFGVYTSPPANCCVSAVIPQISRRGFLIGKTGTRALTVLVPRRWAQCVAASCATPDWHRYRKGQRIFVAAFTDNDAVFAKYLATVI